MKTSLNQIRVELKEIATAHLQINEFFWGDLQDAQAKTVVYPLMNSYFTGNGTSFNKNTSVISMTLEFCDLIYKDDSNLNDVESDLVQICRDVYNTINNSTRWRKIGIVQTATATKFKHGTPDVVACVSLSISFKLRDVSGVCDLPMVDYDFDQDVPAGACPQVRVINTDLSFDQLIDAGDVYELQDITYDITNSEGTTIISGSEVAQANVDQVLPDIDFTDSDGITTQVASGKNITATPTVPIGVSAMTIDDGFGENPDARPFFTLPIVNTIQQLNHFGSKWAFTGTTGGYYDRDTSQYKDVNGTVTTRALVYPDDLLCDWRSLNSEGKFLMYNNNDSYLISTRPAAVITLSTATIGSFTGFRLATLRDGERMQYRSLLRSFGYTELYDTSTFFSLHTKTEYATNSGYTLGNNYGDQSVSNQFLSLRCIVVRNTNISEL